MMNEKSAQKYLPGLLDWLGRTRGVVESEHQGVTYSSDDHFAFMALCFLSKQVEHSYSLERLVPFKDTVLISRAMLEGLAQLLWAAQEITIRPARWRAFAVVEDWKKLPRRRAEGFEPTEEQMERLNLALEEIAPLVLKEKARKSKERGEPMPQKPYYRNWRADKPLSGVFKAVDAGELVEHFYEPYSGWAHWASDAFEDRISRAPDGSLTYLQPNSYWFAAAAVTLGITCLLETAQCAFSHLGLPGGEKVQALRADFEACHARASSGDQPAGSSLAPSGLE